MCLTLVEKIFENMNAYVAILLVFPEPIRWDICQADIADARQSMEFNCLLFESHLWRQLLESFTVYITQEQTFCSPKPLAYS